MEIVRRKLRSATLTDYVLMYLMAFIFGAGAAILLILYGLGNSRGIPPIPETNTDWKEIAQILLWIIGGSGVSGMIWLTVELVIMKREDRVFAAESARIDAEGCRVREDIVFANEHEKP